MILNFLKQDINWRRKTTTTSKSSSSSMTTLSLIQNLLSLLILTTILFVPSLNCESAISCDNFEEIEFGKYIADDKIRRSEATFQNIPVIVEQPFANGSWFSSFSSERKASKGLMSIFDDVHELAQHTKDAALPLFYGGCTTGKDLASTLNVFEYLEQWPSICSDKTVNLEQRIHIAANALELVHVLNNFPIYVHKGAVVRERVVATSMTAMAFGVSAYYVPKVLSREYLGLQPYNQSTPLFSDTSCVTDTDCAHAILVQRQQMLAFKNLESLPDEFRCDLQSNRCHGLDSSANLISICRILLEPLLGLGGHTIPLQVDPKRSHMLTSVMNACQFTARHTRPSVAELQSTLRSSIVGHVSPYFPPKNADLTRYIHQRAALDQVATGIARAGVSPNSPASTRPPPGRFDNFTIAALLKLIMPIEIELPKLKKKDPILTMNHWALTFAHLHEPIFSTPLMRVTGATSDGKPWASSPIAQVDDASTVRTRTGKVYALQGPPDCDLMSKSMLSVQFCSMLSRGLPHNWKDLVMNEHERIFYERVDMYFRKYAPKAAVSFKWVAPLDGHVNEDAGCTPGDDGCPCHVGRCMQGLECMSGRCRARPSHGLDAGGHVINADAAPNVDSLTDSQIAAIRAKIAAHECDSQSSSKPCTEQFVTWRDASNPYGKIDLKVLACVWIADKISGVCVHSSAIAFLPSPIVARPSNNAPVDDSILNGKEPNEIATPNLPPHVVPIAGSIHALDPSAKPRCVESSRDPIDINLRTVKANLLELQIAVRIVRVGSEVAMGVADDNYGARLTKYTAVARITTRGTVEVATKDGARSDTAVALKPNIYYAMRWTLDFASQTFRLEVIDALYNGGQPQIVANKAPFLSSSKWITHFGLLEVRGTDGVVVCVYEPRDASLLVNPDHSTPTAGGHAPSLQFKPPVDSANQFAAVANPLTPKLKLPCCGSDCACCLIGAVQWDVLAYFGERYGLHTDDCNLHDDVANTFCKSTKQASLCEQLRSGKCLFPCRPGQPKVIHTMPRPTTTTTTMTTTIRATPSPTPRRKSSSFDFNDFSNKHKQQNKKPYHRPFDGGVLLKDSSSIDNNDDDDNNNNVEEEGEAIDPAFYVPNNNDGNNVLTNDNGKNNDDLMIPTTPNIDDDIEGFFDHHPQIIDDDHSNDSQEEDLRLKENSIDQDIVNAQQQQQQQQSPNNDDIESFFGRKRLNI